MIQNLSNSATSAKILQVIGDLLGVNPSHILATKLVERRFTPDVITMFDIRARGEGWTYPTPNGALRFKNGDSDAPNKYAWIGHKRDTLLYGPDLQQEIERANGSVWLVTEFDFFAMRSAGIFNVVAQMQGEGSVSSDLRAFLRNMGVQACHIAPDRDEQGTAWSHLVANELSPRGIEVYTYELPYPHQSKRGADIGRLWQEFSRSQSFKSYLLNLPSTELFAQQEIKKKKIIDALSQSDDCKMQIAHALGVTSYNEKGYSKKLICPFHEDSNPSAALHRVFGLHCFKCGWIGWKKLAERLQLEWIPTLPLRTASKIGLGDELIQAMIKSGLSVLAHVLETMYRAGWKPGQRFTIKNLVALGVPYKRARKAFAQMDGKERDRRGTNGKKQKLTFCPILAPFFFTSQEEANLGKKVGHRPAKVKILPNPGELTRAFRVQVNHFSEITLKQNLADWRAEVYALSIDLEPGTYPRKQLCRPLGIAPGTARTYDKRAGISVTPNIERTELKSAVALPETPNPKATWLETEEVVTDKKGREKFRQFAATKTGFARALKSAARTGGSIWLVRQLANDYRRNKKSGDNGKV